jgi:DNA repair protein RadC
MTTLYIRSELGFRIAEPAEIFDRARALISQRYRVGSPVLSSPSLTREYLRLHLGPSDFEQFGVLHLDSRHRLISAEILFRGTLANASVYPREVVKAALSHNAGAAVFFHNHPSGIAEPSHADEIITARLREALALIDVRVLDHLIIAESIYSFAEHGLL